MTTPSDLENSFDAMLSLAGPTVDREFREFAAHPVGQRLLAERPDLNAILGDRLALAGMPAGSFGRAYLDYLGGEGMGSADYFLSAAKLEEKAARLGWSEDHLWFVRYMANSHDLFHVVTGYERDITGEVGVIAFTAGHIPLLPLRLLMPFFASLKPTQPIRWLRFVAQAYRSGRRTPSLACVDYRTLLDRPLTGVRKEIGVRPLGEVHPQGIPMPGQILDLVAANVELV